MLSSAFIVSPLGDDGANMERLRLRARRPEASQEDAMIVPFRHSQPQASGGLAPKRSLPSSGREAAFVSARNSVVQRNESVYTDLGASLCSAAAREEPRAERKGVRV